LTFITWFFAENRHFGNQEPWRAKRYFADGRKPDTVHLVHLEAKIEYPTANIAFGHAIQPEFRYWLLNSELIHHGLSGFSRLKLKQYATYRAHQMVLFRTPPFGGKLKLELQRRVPHSRVGVKALADLPP